MTERIDRALRFSRSASRPRGAGEARGEDPQWLPYRRDLAQPKTPKVPVRPGSGDASGAVGRVVDGLVMNRNPHFSGSGWRLQSINRAKLVPMMLVGVKNCPCLGELHSHRKTS